MMLRILRVSLEKWLYLSLFLLGIIYVSNAWSPSSYGFFLKQADPENTGLVWGKPRPIRSDEWAVVTPLTQAAVHNNFERYNKTSFYNEDLRINYGVPIFDWGLIFKPTMWGYLFLPPAVAYSLHWYLIFIAFVVGYFKLFKEINLNRSFSIILSFSLFFTGVCQFWWDEKGPVYALFPWVIYFLISQKSLYLKLLLFYWVGTSWLLTNFYPPIVISLAFVGALIFLTKLNEWKSVKKCFMLCIASLMVILTAFFYLKDYLINTSQTVYPGHRSFGGGSVYWFEWVSQFLPFSTFNSHFDVLYGGNISEVGAAGYLFILMLLTHVDFRSVKKIRLEKDQKINLMIFFFGLLAMNIWMLFPVPDWAGKLFLWNNVHPNRMKFAEGLLLGITCLYLFQRLEYILNIKRFVIYCGVIFFGWYFMKLHPVVTVKQGTEGINHNYIDLYAIAAIILSYVAVKILSCKAQYAFTATSLLVSFIVFFGFNPIQSARAIFDPHPVITKQLDEYVNPKTGFLAINGYPGALLNGLGYKSVTHVTAVPALKLWRDKFQGLSDKEFNEIFNRYSHIHLEDIAKPFAAAPDVVAIPLSLFNNLSYYPPGKSEQTNALLLKNGMILTGSLIVNSSGMLTSFSPMIGTFNGTSDGEVLLKLCLKKICQSQSVKLINKADNRYMKINLSSPLNVHAGDRLNYTFELKNATQLLAFWPVKSEDKLTIISGNESTVKNLSIKLELSYEVK